MKLYFRSFKKWDREVKLAIDWYKHHSSHKYKAFTVSISSGLLNWDITFVYKNPSEYDKLLVDFDV